MEPIAPLRRRLARLYLALMLVRVASLVLIGLAVVPVLAFPESTRAAALVAVIASSLHISAWTVAGIIGVLWGQADARAVGASQFTSFELWPAAVSAGDLDAHRWALRRVKWILGVSGAVVGVALILAVLAGDVSVSLR